jgi:hypothetical protein
MLVSADGGVRFFLGGGGGGKFRFAALSHKLLGGWGLE